MHIVLRLHRGNLREREIEGKGENLGQENWELEKGKRRMCVLLGYLSGFWGKAKGEDEKTKKKYGYK